jgi:hypothetical protein
VQRHHSVSQPARKQDQLSLPGADAQVVVKRWRRTWKALGETPDAADATHLLQQQMSAPWVLEAELGSGRRGVGVQHARCPGQLMGVCLVVTACSGGATSVRQ